MMIEQFQSKLLNPDTQFLAIYVSVLVLIAFIGLLVQFFKIKQLKLENESLKSQLNDPSKNKLNLNKNVGIQS